MKLLNAISRNSSQTFRPGFRRQLTLKPRLRSLPLAGPDYPTSARKFNAPDWGVRMPHVRPEKLSKPPRQNWMPPKKISLGCEASLKRVTGSSPKRVVPNRKRFERRKHIIKL